MPVAQLGSRPRLCTRFIPGSEGAPASPLVLISTSPHIPPAESLLPSSVSSSTDWTLGTCLPCPRLPLPATSASPSLTPGQLWARDQPPVRLRSLMQLEGCCRGFAGQRSLQGLRDSQSSHPAATPDHHGGAGEWRPHRPRPGPREEVVISGGGDNGVLLFPEFQLHSLPGNVDRCPLPCKLVGPKENTAVPAQK